MKVRLADTKELKEKAYAVRYQVFVEEQKVSREDEFDEHEDTSRHFVALTNDGKAVGAARWRKTADGVKLERFAVLPDARMQGVGASLVAAVLYDISQEATGEKIDIYLHAQLSAMPLYEKFNFKKEGTEFVECDIRHYKMVLQIPENKRG